ncbi:uncharacterized protein LOC108162473 [Drosophila miranda]|uniref:uncharacterized protein LOC108162473 n=1 Tax=Drosophila miranda TaxID=7229 RepID=UPI0007E5F7C4|nr:uncharacterized protein LOC108162473 [Drosophila miranda]
MTHQIREYHLPTTSSSLSLSPSPSPKPRTRAEGIQLPNEVSAAHPQREREREEDATIDCHRTNRGQAQKLLNNAAAAAAAAAGTPTRFGGGSSGSLHSSDVCVVPHLYFAMQKTRRDATRRPRPSCSSAKSSLDPHVEYTKYNTNCGVEHHVLLTPKEIRQREMIDRSSHTVDESKDIVRGTISKQAHGQRKCCCLFH